MNKNLQLTLAIVGVLAIGAALYCGAGWVEISGAALLANAPGAIDVKAIEEAIDKATKKVKETTDRMQQALDQAIDEVKRVDTVTGKTNDELKAASAAAAKTQGELKAVMDRVLEVEQKLAKRAGLGDSKALKSWGEIVVASDQFKAAGGKGKGKPEMDPVDVGPWFSKTRILSADVQTTGTVPMFGQAERVPGVITPPERMLVARSLIPVYATEASVIEYCKENVFTNAAAPQGAGSSPTETEGQPKAESALTFTFTQAAIITIAHWIPASRQVLADAKGLSAYVDNRLRYGLDFEVDDEVLNGLGTGGELNGLVNQATAYNRTATADNMLDTLLKAFLQVTLSDYTADGVVLSNEGWTDLLLLKDTQGRYLFGNPADVQNDPRVWGRRVVPTNAFTRTQFLVGAFQLSAALWDREQATVRVSEHHENFFIKNMVAILAELRLALTVFRTTAIVKGNFFTAGQPN